MCSSPFLFCILLKKTAAVPAANTKSSKNRRSAAVQFLFFPLNDFQQVIKFTEESYDNFKNITAGKYVAYGRKKRNTHKKITIKLLDFENC